MERQAAKNVKRVRRQERAVKRTVQSVMGRTCGWCGAPGKKIGQDYAFDIMHCTECDHEWEA